MIAVRAFCVGENEIVVRADKAQIARLLERGVFAADAIQLRHELDDVARRALPIALLELVFLRVEILLASELFVVAVAEFEETAHVARRIPRILLKARIFTQFKARIDTIHRRERGREQRADEEGSASAELQIARQNIGRVRP